MTRKSILESYDYAALVTRIRALDPAGSEELYGILRRGFRYLLFRDLGVEDLDDGLHDVFLTIENAIRQGRLIDPARVMGYARTILHRHIAHVIAARVWARRHLVDLAAANRRAVPAPDALEKAIRAEHVDIALRMLSVMRPRDREVLTRCYVEEQSDAEVRAAMRLTVIELRLLKSRAHARLDERLLRTIA